VYIAPSKTGLTSGSHPIPKGGRDPGGKLQCAHLRQQGQRPYQLPLAPPPDELPPPNDDRLDPEELLETFGIVRVSVS